MLQTMNSVRSFKLSLKYQRLTPSDCEDIRIRKFECVANTFIAKIFLKNLPVTKMLCFFHDFPNNSILWF